MKTGLMIPQGWRMDLGGIPAAGLWQAITDAAQRVEVLGYDSIWVYDHFHTVPKPTQDPTLECWSLMAALSQVTSRIRLGQMCTCNGYRNPAYLAKVASTVDVMSGGRLELGIGGGWYEHEYRAYGYDYPSMATRLRMLEETVQILKGMWTEPETVFEGKFYSVQGAINQPPGLQQPHIPLWVCGGGETMTLRIAAKYGDYTNWNVDVAGFRHKTDVLQRHCEEVGRSMAGIVRSLHIDMLVAENKAQLETATRRYAGQASRKPEELAASPMVGLVEEVLETLLAYKEAGCGYLVAYVPDLLWGRTAEIFMEQIHPKLA